MNTRFKLLILAALCCSLTGCTLERSWFQMSSNSPMPFFGFDFRLPRKTTSLEPASHEEKLARHWDSESEVHTVSLNEEAPKATPENLLSSIPKIINRAETESLSFTGPKARFSR